MARKPFTEDDLLTEEKEVTEQLRPTLPASKKRDGLKLTGLEVLGLLGAKVVLPIICGFISRTLYDTYKNLQTQSKAKAARKDILAQQGKPGQIVDEETIKNDVTQTLVSEGIAEEQAQKIVAQMLEKVKARV